MTPFMNTLRTSLNNRARYRQTLSELYSLPMDVRIDLDIAGVEEKVAYKAVYG